MKTITRPLHGATVVAVRTGTGLVVRGGPGVVSERRGVWEVIVDDHGLGTVSAARLRRVLTDAERDPVDAVLRHFDPASSELFALVGPPGVIAGAGPRSAGHAPVAVWVEPAEGFMALGFAALVDAAAVGWLTLPSGLAVCWGPLGPEAYLDLVTGECGLWEPAV